MTNPASYRGKFGERTVARGKGSRGIGCKAWWDKVKDCTWNPIKGLYSEFDGSVPCFGSSRPHGKFHPNYYRKDKNYKPINYERPVDIAITSHTKERAEAAAQVAAEIMD